jgi:hypothetical protein
MQLKGYEMGLLGSVTVTEAMDEAMDKAMSSINIPPGKAAFVRFCIAYTLEHEFEITLPFDEVHPKRGRPSVPDEDE